MKMEVAQEYDCESQNKKNAKPIADGSPADQNQTEALTAHIVCWSEISPT
jgi:hypothetical protein